MSSLPTAALTCAVTISLVAAVTDARFGTIPNSITIPLIVLAPAMYALRGGAVASFTSVLSAGLCLLVPYTLFRAGAMGGGDVKLFAALGAITGYDVLAGLSIQALAFAFGMVAVVASRIGGHASLVKAGAATWSRTSFTRRPEGDDNRSNGDVKLGGFVLLATFSHAASVVLRSATQ